MTQIPKPARRGPKPRKRISRNVRPLAKRATDRARLIRRCDDLFSELVRARRRCERCWSHVAVTPLDCAHVFSRRFLGTRWVPSGALALCRKCHRFLGSASVYKGSRMETLYRVLEKQDLRRPSFESLKEVALGRIPNYWALSAELPSMLAYELGK